MKTKITKNDWIQIVLNLIAFAVLFTAPTGRGSFWGFTSFFVLSGIILLEISFQEDKTAIWVWRTKTLTYLFFVIKFTSNIGPFNWIYVIMIILSMCTLLVSKRIKKRAISMWGTNIAYIIGGVMYILAVFGKPDDYGLHHILFWFVNWISYGILIYEILKEKKERVNLIIPIYAFIFCLVYIAIIYFAWLVLWFSMGLIMLYICQSHRKPCWDFFMWKINNLVWWSISDLNRWPLQCQCSALANWANRPYLCSNRMYYCYYKSHL